MARSTSEADRQLLLAIVDRGATASASQLERWRSAGLLPRTHREALGRGRGSRSTYPPTAVDVAYVLARVAGQGRPLHRGVVALFLTGHDVPEDALGAAIRWVMAMPFVRSSLGALPAIALGLHAITSRPDSDDVPDSTKRAAHAAFDHIATEGVNSAGSDQLVQALSLFSTGTVAVDPDQLRQRLIARELSGEPLVPTTWPFESTMDLTRLDPVELAQLRDEAIGFVRHHGRMSSTQADELCIAAPEVVVVGMALAAYTQAAFRAL